MFEHSRDTFYVSDGISFSDLRFENDVEMYGAQTRSLSLQRVQMFENDVEMYGAQTQNRKEMAKMMFENDVEMYGAQTFSFCDYS